MGKRDTGMDYIDDFNGIAAFRWLARLSLTEWQWSKPIGNLQIPMMLLIDSLPDKIVWISLKSGVYN
jgi:hypothetical protein